MKDESAHIIQLLQRGDKEAISKLFDQYAPNLYGVVLRIMKDEGLAEDVMQEAFVKVWKNGKKYNPEKAGLFAWLMTIFRNTAIDKIRSTKKHRNEIQMPDSPVYDKGYRSINPETLDLKKHISGLDGKYQEVMEGFFYHGLTHQQLSESMNLPLGTVKSRIKIALRELRKIYVDEKTILLLICLFHL